MKTKLVSIIGMIAIFVVFYFAISWYVTIGEELDCNYTNSGCITASSDLKPNVTIIAGSTIMKHNLSPSEITIRIGEQVTWYNDDDTSHWIDADDGSWSSGLISPQHYFTMKFEKIGTFTYHGQPWIRGTVIVTEKHDEMEDMWITDSEMPTQNQIIEKEAISRIKKQYPQLQEFPSDGLPPKIILSEKSDDGWRIIFETLGSGYPILEAECFLVDNSGIVTKIGQYRHSGNMETDISFDMCS